MWLLQNESTQNRLKIQSIWKIWIAVWIICRHLCKELLLTLSVVPRGTLQVHICLSQVAIGQNWLEQILDSAPRIWSQGGFLGPDYSKLVQTNTCQCAWWEFRWTVKYLFDPIYMNTFSGSDNWPLHFVCVCPYSNANWNQKINSHCYWNGKYKHRIHLK